jgi:chemotaxis protein histidine kinase CheA
MSDLEIVKEFLVESYENLDRFSRNLVELETRPADTEILADIFRTIHTIKGTSGFLAFAKLEAVAQAGESLLAHLQDGEIRLNPEIAVALGPWSTRSVRCSKRSARAEPMGTMITGISSGAWRFCRHAVHDGQFAAVHSEPVGNLAVVFNIEHGKVCVFSRFHAAFAVGQA